MAIPQSLMLTLAAIPAAATVKDDLVGAHRQCVFSAATPMEASINCNSAPDQTERGREAALQAARAAAAKSDDWTGDRAQPQPTMRAMLDQEQVDWESYRAAACAYFEDRELWGSNGKTLHGPLCRIRLVAERTLALNQLVVDMTGK